MGLFRIVASAPRRSLCSSRFLCGLSRRTGPSTARTRATSARSRWSQLQTWNHRQLTRSSHCTCFPRNGAAGRRKGEERVGRGWSGAPAFWRRPACGWYSVLRLGPRVRGFSRSGSTLASSSSAALCGAADCRALASSSEALCNAAPVVPSLPASLPLRPVPTAAHLSVVASGCSIFTAISENKIQFARTAKNDSEHGAGY